MIGCKQWISLYEEGESLKDVGSCRQYLYIWSKNDVITAVRKRYCTLGLVLG